MSAIKILSQRKVASGILTRLSFKSQVLNSTTTTSIYIPKSAPGSSAKPALYWLSGLTCTDENFVEKAGAFHSASKHSLSLVIPDTSPRGDGVPNDEAYDLGQGAGFYLNATEDPWKEHYQMYDYITKELPEVLANSEFNICKNYRSISGHSMGGHGALTIAMKDEGKSYASVSAFAPIVAPAQVDWGKKAFTNYLGSVENGAKEYDATNLLLENGPFPELGTILIDQGTDDEFLDNQLKTELFENACKQVGQSKQINMRDGYDHSYFFILSFIDEHIQHASKAIKARMMNQ